MEIVVLTNTRQFPLSVECSSEKRVQDGKAGVQYYTRGPALLPGGILYEAHACNSVLLADLQADYLKAHLAAHTEAAVRARILLVRQRTLTGS